LKKYKIGYTTGVFDLFHVGHLNILKKAKMRCDFLIVGVTTDELVSYKNKNAIIPQKERLAIIKSVKYVDKVVSQESMDKFMAWKKYKFNVIFVGTDWKGTDKWIQLEEQFKNVGVDIVYIPYTKGTSSTILRDVLSKIS
jgi:glycerol-3-phosphate cytidylyltransferase